MAATTTIMMVVMVMAVVMVDKVHELIRAELISQQGSWTYPT